RLAWGINDFDEAAPLPYTNDLVRLATSARLAAQLDGWALSAKGICEAIVSGYRAALEARGRPFVIDEENRWFAPMIRKGLRDPVRFWKGMRALSELSAAEVPDDARARLEAALPDANGANGANGSRRFARRRAGLGSLGKPRFVVLAEWRGGL